MSFIPDGNKTIFIPIDNSNIKMCFYSANYLHTQMFSLIINIIINRFKLKMHIILNYVIKLITIFENILLLLFIKDNNCAQMCF